MKAFWFKFTSVDNSYIGLAVAKDYEELFWVIDEHGDPFMCEVMRVEKSASFCARELTEDEGFDDVEFSELKPCTEDERWKHPDWEKWKAPRHFFGITKETKNENHQSKR